MTVIASIVPDYPARIHLHSDTVDADVHPLAIYQEVRALRRTDESLRKFDMFCTMFGKVAKGGGKFTERYLRLNNDCRIVPFDTDHELTITGTIITDTGQEGTACFDRSPLSVATIVDINYVPPQVEVIEGSGGGGSGATPQEIWEYATRTLTGGTVGLSVEQATQLKELWQLQGLDPSNPMTVTQTQRLVDAITILLTGDGVTSTTATRQ